MIDLIVSFITLLQAITPETHIISFSFCPFIFGGFAIIAIVKWIKLGSKHKREMIWSICVILLAILVIVFVGLNTFLWLNDILFYVFIGVRFTLLIFFAFIANPHLKWTPLKMIFTTRNSTKED
ncbi:MAG: hypothetical protein FK733_08880 [Asgard group archaeon]|nr:hypothetical protein [Asgard group archaeon]